MLLSSLGLGLIVTALSGRLLSGGGWIKERAKSPEGLRKRRPRRFRDFDEIVRHRKELERSSRVEARTIPEVVIEASTALQAPQKGSAVLDLELFERRLRDQYDDDALALLLLLM